MTSHRVLLLLSALIVAGSMSGCSGSAPQATSLISQPTEPSATATAHAGPGSTTVPTGELADMGDDEKLATINSRFPVEYPVIDGEVVGREVASDGSRLSFDVGIAAPADSVEAWYRATMEGRLFRLVDERRSDDGSVDLTFNRSGVVYSVLIVPVQGGSTAVRSTIDASK